MHRRLFLKETGLLTAGLFNGLQLPGEITVTSIGSFGVQLYSVRDRIPNNPKDVMRQLAQMGYKEFESYEGDQGFLWGMTPNEIRAFLNDMGVKMISTHFNYLRHVDKPDILKKSIDLASEAGLRYLLCPYVGPQQSMDDWKRIADQFNQTGELVRRTGLRFGYHNHDYSFKPINGQIPQEYLLANTDPTNVMFELDLCWIDVAGQDTIGHLKKWGSRYELCHIKDYSKQNSKPVQNDLGKGQVNFKPILQEAFSSGIKHFIVEQEEYPVSSLTSMQKDADYMRQLTF